MVARLRARLAQENGMTLIELLTTVAILGIVMSGLVTMFVSGLHAETDMNTRFQAQQNARLALTSMRKEVGTACSLTIGTVTGETAGSLVTLGEGCSDGVASSTVSWCAASSNGAAPYALYRQSGSSCAASTGAKRADSLQCAGTTASCPTPDFAAVVVTGQRPQLQVRFPVEANLTNNRGLYTLTDTITLQNAGVS